MKTYTNHTPGLRGIVLKDGTTHWIEPGASAEIDTKNVASVPDMGKPSDAGAAEGAEIEALQSQIADLTKKVDELSKANSEAATTKTADEKTIADLTKKVDELSKK